MLFAAASTTAVAQNATTTTVVFDVPELSAPYTEGWEGGAYFFDEDKTFTIDNVDLTVGQLDPTGFRSGFHRSNDTTRIRIYSGGFFSFTTPEGSKIQSVSLYTDLKASGAGYEARATVEGYEREVLTSWPEGKTFTTGNRWTPQEDTNEFVLDNTAESGVVSFNYAEIVYTSTGTGIEGINADNDAPVEYFNLNGMRVDNPTDGIFIRRQGSKVSKVVVK